MILESRVIEFYWWNLLQVSVCSRGAGGMGTGCKAVIAICVVCACCAAVGAGLGVTFGTFFIVFLRTTACDYDFSSDPT